MVWASLRLFTQIDDWVSFISCGVTGALAYVVVLLVFCLDAGERKDFQAIRARVLR